jgi:flagellar biosynthetic protein FlhB
MADNQQEQDRNEPATPYKLREAKKRGQVAKSQEVNSLAILCAGFLILALWGLKVGESLSNFFRIIFSNAGQFDGTPSAAQGLYNLTIETMAVILGPMALVVIVAGVLANIGQTGFILSGFPLKPDLQKLNPVQGFKRVFSKKMLIEALKSIFKILLFGLVIYVTIRSMLPELLSLVNVDVSMYPASLGSSIQALLGRLLIVVLLIALIDLAYTRWDYSKQMRMSRRELKEEVKRREGDPLIRAKVRALQKEALKRATSLRNIPDADILITNPTHISVAIQYDRDTMKAPLVIAKGAGELAMKMREIARVNKVAIIENKSVARYLFKKVNLDEPVPADMFPAVAKMLAWVYLQKKMKARFSGSEKANYVN